MKQIFTLSFFMLLSFSLSAQDLVSKKYSSRLNNSHTNLKAVNFNGQWRGGFDETPYGLSDYGGGNIVYVLELTTESSSVSGYSYTYFTEGNKKYYTICRLSGSLNRATNDLVVTEVERTKFNTPPNFVNCFQTHRLHYEKDSNDVEVLRGTWIPAPNQGAGCGSGTTVLSRRIVDRLPLGIKTKKNEVVVKSPVKKPAPKKQIAAAPRKTTPAIAKKTPTVKQGIEKNQIVKGELPIQENTITNPEISSSTLSTHSPKYESR